VRDNKEVKMKVKNSSFSVVFCFAIITFTITSFHEQSFAYQWSKTFGGSAFDVGYSVKQTDDGGFIVAGYTGYSPGAGGSDVYLIKTDASGDQIWSKTFGGAADDAGESVQQTDDGGFIVAGSTNSIGAGGSDVYLIKIDASGKELWSKTFGGVSNDDAKSVRQTNDGGFVIVGDEGFNDFTDESYVYLIKTNALGVEQWSKTFGEASVDRGYSVQQTDDGGFIVAGYTSSFGAGGSDVYLIRTDTSGDELWSKTFGGASWDSSESVQQTDDGGFIIAGLTWSFGAGGLDVYLIYYQPDGDFDNDLDVD